MTGAPAFVSMPGLVAVVAGMALGGLGAVVLVVGLAILAASARRFELRPPGAGMAVAGLILVLAGAALTLFGDEAGYGSPADAASLVLAPLGIAMAILAGRLVTRSVRSRRSRRATAGGS